MGHRRAEKEGEAAADRALRWVLRKLPLRVRVVVGALAAMLAVVALNALVRKRDHFFVVSEAVHAVGILVLIFKLTTRKSCSGLSLKTQELTATFLIARLCCSLMIEYNIHTFLDFATLVSTIWVICIMRFKLRSTYSKELDNMPRYYVIVPCLILASFIQPYLLGYFFGGALWAFCVYLESVSVLPQLRLLHNAKMVEPFTGHYVFALGVSRFFGFAHWVIELVATRGKYLFAARMIWFPAVVLAELVQTVILADFCYYYVKSYMSGEVLVQLPV